VPTLERDAALGVIQPWLAQQDVFSRGRFGSWRYEIGNMDHAVKMGIDIARRLVLDEPEELVGSVDGETQRARVSSAQTEPAIRAE
jgi:predicted ABC-type sugar transport system permease subunit